jgi:6-pyruvoyltetrahydropterin/6-carboxytetrahydropterin synthase
MPTARVTRRVHFSAGHRLHNPSFDEERNRETYGLCNRPNGHGHNYDLEVTVEGEIDPNTGFVMDLKRLKALLGRSVLADLDHANLNLDVPWLDGIIPTTENLAVAIWGQLDGDLGPVRLVSIRLWETERNMVEYRGEQEPGGTND